MNSKTSSKVGGLEDLLSFGKVYLWILGGPGVGKTTQSLIISKKIPLKLYSFTPTKEDDTEEKLQIINNYEINSNASRVNERINKIKKDILNDAGAVKGYIFDGYPTNIVEANLFIAQIGLPTVIIHLVYPFDGMLSRCKNKYGDRANAENLRKNIILTGNNIEPIIKKFEHKVISFYSITPPDAVAHNIFHSLKEKFLNQD